MPLPTDADLGAFYGDWPVISLEDLKVDKVGIINLSVYASFQNPIDLSYAALTAAPAGLVPLPCVGVRLHKLKGYHTWIYDFEGVLDPGSPGTNLNYELEGSDSNEPIETHPDFLLLVKKYGGTYNADGSFAGFPATMPGDATTKNPLYGATDFADIGWIWAKSYASGELPVEVYENAGCIETPDWGDQEPQELGQRDALKLAPRCSWRGNVWSISERWRIGGRNGINKDVYKKIT